MTNSTGDALFGNHPPEDYDLRIASIESMPDDGRRFSFGLANIDEVARPIRPGEFVVIGAREGQGKTSIAERLALSNSTRNRVLFASFEMPAALIKDRCLAKLMGVGLEAVEERRKERTDDFEYAMERLQSRDLMVWHPRIYTQKSLRNIMQRAEDVTASILIIDYTRMIAGWEPGTKASGIINTLADWAHDQIITTVLLTQLRDEAVGIRPHNGHIQDTSSVPQRADRIALLWRPQIGLPLRDTFAEVSITKNRYGPVFRGHAHWMGESMDFYDMEPQEEAHVSCCASKRRRKSLQPPEGDETV